MRLPFAVFLLLAIALSFTSALPGKVVGASNADAIKRGLPLPRPRSIVNCARDNSTCFEEFKKMKATRAQKRANPSAVPTTIPFWGQNFGRTCHNIRLDTSRARDPKLRANCLNQRGDLIPTTLDLDTCIGYSTSLNCWTGNGFGSGLCTGCTLSGTTLRCNCGFFMKLPYSLDLNQCVGNRNGNFECP